MAGTFTHWMIVEDALTKLPSGAKKLNLALSQKRKPYVLLGAVSPDLPYLVHPVSDSLIKTHSWADRMHYQSTGSFLRHGMENLLLRQKDDFNICYAWLFGYASHVITDVVIHPVVNSIVGPYRFNSTAHRECEMTQDSLIYNWRMKGEEITKTKYHKTLIKASNRPNEGSSRNSRHIKKCVKTFWLETIKDTYPGGSDKFADIEPDLWFKEYLDKMGMSTNPAPLFRHLGEEKSIVYMSAKDLNSAECAEQKSRYFDNVSLPNGGSDSFISVFRKAVAQVGHVWRRMAEDIERKDFSQTDTYIKNWDLDQGIDMDLPDLWRD